MRICELKGISTCNLTEMLDKRVCVWPVNCQPFLIRELIRSTSTESLSKCSDVWQTSWLLRIHRYTATHFYLLCGCYWQRRCKCAIVAVQNVNVFYWAVRIKLEVQMIIKSRCVWMVPLFVPFRQRFCILIKTNGQLIWFLFFMQLQQIFSDDK